MTEYFHLSLKVLIEGGGRHSQRGLTNGLEKQHSAPLLLGASFPSRERRAHLSDGDPKGYDDSKARLRLRQAFGRLVRSATDRGVFVLLDRRAPSRLLSAFPPGVEAQRVGLAEAVAQTRAFLKPAITQP
jgi:hypothetical protein